VLAKYPNLRATPSRDPAERTEWILVGAGGVAVSSGTALAENLAARTGRPLLVIQLGAPHAVG
jgi:hypothetical protein